MAWIGFSLICQRLLKIFSVAVALTHAVCVGMMVSNLPSECCYYFFLDVCWNGPGAQRSAHAREREEGDVRVCEMNLTGT